MKSQWSRDEFFIARSQGKAVFIRVALDEKQEEELNELLGKPENAPIKINLETRTYLKWSGEIDDRDFWTKIAYQLPHKQATSTEGGLKDTLKLLGSNLRQIFTGRKNSGKEKKLIG